MVKKAYSLETKLACSEWFHSILKSETFYLHNWKNLIKDSITDIVNRASYFMMKLEFNRD